MAKPVGADDLAKQVRVEALPATLRPQVLRPCRGQYEMFTHVLLLDAGQAAIEMASGTAEVDSPAGVILPASSAMTLTLGAGTSGWLLGLSPMALANAIGAGPESSLLAPLGLHQIIARDFHPQTVPDPDMLARAILAELARGAEGGQLAVVAYMRLILLSVWRESRVEVSAPGHGSELHILEGFRRTVEVHFRSHKRIADYALLLGITESRLRRICQRNLQRSPLELVHLRMMREATTWLERSGKSIAEIAHALGFAESTEFSHFFKRHSQLSPRQYRETVRRRAEAVTGSLTSFADWP
ncbi:helix-turn-helix domain-containing protein [Paracoccus limosus]|uniref:Helix-turn-helix domain-containing protein n=1 Tax=Paracoccus limosus TaxID=913252 RepID=A0A844H7D9_9RHOB|nr:AraC family transcriptional regulator [Paracoccus limosus]MTH35503.1 helix-turn-helix domain-containing protein [Paracoccus limosus]